MRPMLKPAVNPTILIISNRLARNIALNAGENRALDLFDANLVAFIESPLFDPLGAQQPGLRENFQMLAGGGLADAKSLRDR